MRLQPLSRLVGGFALLLSAAQAAGQGNFRKWFSDKAFGGSIYTNYECTPVGAVSHTDEPNANVNDAAIYFGLWAQGKNFAICAWNSRRTERFQAVGDPFVRR